MPQGPTEVNLRIYMDAEIEDLKVLAADVSELADLVPEWNEMEAGGIRDRIGNRIASWIKARQETA